MEYRFGWYVIKSSQTQKKRFFANYFQSNSFLKNIFHFRSDFNKWSVSNLLFIFLDHTPELNWNLETYGYVSLEIVIFYFLKAWLFYSKHSLYIDQIWICTESHRYKLEKPNIICWIVICFYSNLRNVDYINIRIKITGWIIFVAKNDTLSNRQKTETTSRYLTTPSLTLLKTLRHKVVI